MEDNLNADKYMSINFGLENLATCVTNEGASMIFDGKRLKSYNRLYNKINANIQSSKDKSGIKGFTRTQVFNVRKRNRRINHAMSVAVSQIIKYCLKNQIVIWLSIIILTGSSILKLVKSIIRILYRYRTACYVKNEVSM